MEIVRGDITGLKVDAIVNAANHTLLGGRSVVNAAKTPPQIIFVCTDGENESLLRQELEALKE